MLAYFKYKNDYASSKEKVVADGLEGANAIFGIEQD
jgi:hypothetical protein